MICLEDSYASAVHGVETRGGKLAVITCHFNWCGYQRPRQNLRRFLRQMDAAGVAVFGIEAALPGHPFVTSGREGWKQVVANQHALLFQKEALLNSAAQLPPPEFTKLAWVDADVLFMEPSWHKITESLLDIAPVVQPFERAIWTDREGAEEMSMPSACKMRTEDPRRGHPGFAMAARRTLWTLGPGLFGRSLTGAGDVMFAFGLYGQGLHGQAVKAIGGNAVPYSQWRKDFRSWLMSEDGGKTLYAPGTVVHEWHGDRVQRAYSTRHDALAAFDSARHVVLHPDGYYQWTADTPPELMSTVATYFANRKEDG